MLDQRDDAGKIQIIPPEEAPAMSGKRKVGRPRGSGKDTKLFKAELMKALKRAEKTGGPNAGRRIVQKLVDKALEGDMRAIELIFDRVDGKVPTPVGGSDELEPIQFEVVIGGVNR